MTKRKKVVLSAAVALCLLLMGLGIFLGVRTYQNTPRYTVKDTLLDGQGKKATVILLGGQSNASGCSRDDYLQQKVSAETYATYAAGFDNVYIHYVAGQNGSEGFVKCSVLQGELGGYFGPELGIAEELNRRYPDRTFFIIKCAWGGTNLFEQWLSPSGDGKTGDLYRKFVAFVEGAMKYLVSKNYDVSIAGMCWMQGESDSFFTETAWGYKENLTNFINDIRREFRHCAAEDGIAFIDAYIADNPVFWVHCDVLNRMKKEVADSSEMNRVVDTVAHGLDCTKEPEEQPDIPHNDSSSEIKLGRLFAKELIDFFD